jgi:MFS family permease
MPSNMSFESLGRAFKNRNYRIFFCGQIVSLTGTWLTATATSWLVFRLTHSPFYLGLVGFAGQIPSFLLAPLAGVQVDRWNRHRVLLATQTAAMIQSFLLAYLTLSGSISVQQVLVLSVFQGLINAYDMPARQVFNSEMIEDRRDLGNAIALNSAMFNAARLIGPSLGGFIIAFWNEGACFLIDGFSYLAVILSLCLIRLKPKQIAAHSSDLWSAFKDAAHYAFNFHPIREIIFLVGSISLLGTGYFSLMPIFASEILHGGPRLLGLLMASSGCGALLGALSLAARANVRGLGKLVSTSALGMGVALIAFGFSSSLWLSMPILFVLGYSMISMMAACNTIIQTLVDDAKRGRVMSFFMMAFMGMMPLSSLLGGLLAARVSAQFTVILSGAACVVSGILFARKLPRIRLIARPVYVERGIIAPDEL